MVAELEPIAKPKHIAIDTKSADGVVYLKFASKNDAGKAFAYLNGNRLRATHNNAAMAAKYVPDERYAARFSRQF